MRKPADDDDQQNLAQKIIQYLMLKRDQLRD